MDDPQHSPPHTTQPQIEPEIHDGFDAMFRRVRKYGTKAARAKWPYYAEEYANVVKKLLDNLATTKRPQIVRSEGIKIATIKSQYYQGLQYLLDYMDPDKRYDMIKNATKASTDHYNSTITITHKLSASRAFDNAVNQALTNALDGGWRERFEDYIMTAKAGEKFHITNVILSDADVAYAKNMLVPVDELFFYRIDSKEILVVRDNK